MRSAFFLSHNGLGDNITSIGAINYLLKYYKHIYFLCKDIYKDNVELLFENKSVTVIDFDSKNEFAHCRYIISNVNIDENDIFICGCHKNYLNSYITNEEILNRKKDNSYSTQFNHIYDFYNDIGLDLSIYFENFDIDSSYKSKEYYNELIEYTKNLKKIVFLHTEGSNRYIDITNTIQKYTNDNYIIICANKNVYDISNPNYIIANKFVNIKVAYYIDIIKNADIIHVIDSCFACIVYPLYESRRIEPTECKIHEDTILK